MTRFYPLLILLVSFGISHAQQSTVVDTAALLKTATGYTDSFKTQGTRIQGQYVERYNKQKAVFTDTTLLKKETERYTGLLKKEGGKVKGQLNGYLNKLKSVADESNRKVSIQAKLLTEAEYVSNSFTPAQANGIYYRAGVNGMVKLGKLPFNAGITFNFKDNKPLWNYTLFNFSFDSRKYMNELKGSYLSYLGDMKNFYSPEVATEVMSYKDSLNKWQDLQNTLSDKQYYQNIQSWTAQLKPLQDALLKYAMDSCKRQDGERISDSIKVYKNKSKEFASLDKYKSNNTQLQQKLDKYEAYVDKVKNTDNVLAQPEIKKQIEKAGLLVKSSKFFAGIQKLNIGRVALNLSDFTIHNQSIYGFNFDYLIKSFYYVGVGFGSLSPNNFQYTPSLSLQQSLPKFDSPKLVGYLRLGVGSLSDNYLHLIYMAYGEKFKAQTGYVSPNNPPANSVMALVFKQKIAKAFAFEGELATSNSNYLNRSATFAPFELKSKNSKFNFAAKGIFSGSIKKSGTAFSAKVNMLSANFVSAGNMFSRRDFFETGATINQPAANGKLNFTSLVNYNRSGLFSGVNKQSFLTASNTIAAAAFSGAQYALTYTIAKQFGLAYNGFNMHALNLQQQYSYGKRKVQFSTVLTSGYTSTQSLVSEQKFKSHQVQNSLQQIMVLPKGVRLLIGGGLNYTQIDKASAQYYYWIETGNNFVIKQKAAISYSVKYLKDNLGVNNVFINTNLTGELCKGLQAFVRGQMMVSAGSIKRYNVNSAVGLSYQFEHSFVLKRKADKKRATADDKITKF